MQRQRFQAGALNTELINDSRQLHYQKNIRTQQGNSQHTEAARSSKNGWLSPCLLKADFKSFGTVAHDSWHERSAARWRNAKNIRLKLIFNISDQGPKKFRKWVSGISNRAFSGQAESQGMPKTKDWEFQNQLFWASAHEMPNLSLRIGHWKCPNEFRKPLNEYFQTM